MKNIESYNPIFPFLYFLFIVIITMLSLNPIIIGIAFTGSIICIGVIFGFKEMLSTFLSSVLIIILILAMNILLVHKGSTILFFINDSPITKESAAYGLSVGTMLVSVYNWFKSYSKIINSDKIIYLFGNRFPNLALLISATFGFIPKLKRQAKQISTTQKAMGMYPSNSLTDRFLASIKLVSTLIQWSIESQIETSLSMKARGYGLKGRSFYSVYTFSFLDIFYLTIAICLFVLSSVSIALGTNINFYPSLTPLGFNTFDIISYASFAILAFFITFIELKEIILWQFLTSKI